MKYLSVCSGIEAATVAWHNLEWTPVAFSEIDPFPCAVLAHHYPNVANWGDMTKFLEWPDADVDVLVGGTPCQSFSVAGLRKGLADPRGNLMLTYLAIAERYRPEWLVWENVPGVLSSNAGRDFGALLGGLGQLGYGFAYRVLDAQFFGVAQRRRRVFVVANARGWQRAAAVLFERHSLSGNPPPSREAGQRVANSLVERPDRGGGNSEGQRLIAQPYPVANCLTQRMHKGINTTLDEGQTPVLSFHNRQDPDVSGDITHPLGAKDNGMAVMQPVAFDTTQITSAANYSNPKPGDPCHPLAAGAHAPAVAFDPYNQATAPVTHTLRKGRSATGDEIPQTVTNMQVRRLTPRECERLQGFPDDYTLIPHRGKPAADGPRYKALGNSMAVPVMRWIGQRIAAVDTLK